MKKAVVMMIAVAMVFVAAAARADSVSLTVPLIVTVPAQFGFILDKYSHDFGTVQTGAGAQTTFGIFCRSNHGIVWYMGIQAPQFENESGDILPSDPGFVMAAWSNADPEQAQGTFLYIGPVPYSMMYDFYESTIEEGGDPFVPMTLGLWIAIPSTQPSGLYSTDMVLTMHE